MNEFIIKLFIKKHKDITNIKIREKYNILSSIIGSISNTLLFIIKLSIGIFSNSISIIADSFNNLSDIGSSIILFIVSKISSKPADKDHPFGHGRIEYISSLIISFLIILVGLDLIKLSIKKIISPDIIQVNILIILLLILSFIVKLWLYFFNRKMSIIIDSVNLKAISKDSLTDSIATLGTIFSMIISYIFGYSIDGYIGIIVSLFIIYSGYSISSETITLLIGKAIEPETINKIESIILENDIICGVHKIEIHNYGPTRYLGSAHAEIKKECNIIEAHNCIDNAEKKIKKTMEIDIVIHIDPV